MKKLVTLVKQHVPRKQHVTPVKQRPQEAACPLFGGELYSQPSAVVQLVDLVAQLVSPVAQLLFSEVACQHGGVGCHLSLPPPLLPPLKRE